MIRLLDPAHCDFKQVLNISLCRELWFVIYVPVDDRGLVGWLLNLLMQNGDFCYEEVGFFLLA